MLVAKQVADIVTLSRGLLTLVLIWLGVTQREAALPLICWVMIADWTGDLVDGPMARRSQVQRQSWIGDHDLEIDIMVSFGLLVYLLAAGYVSLPIVAVYLLFWALIFWRWGVPRSLGMLIQAPIYGLFLWTAIRETPASGWWVMGWIAAVLVITWPKFPREVVPGFLHGMAAVWRQYRRE